MTFAHPVDIYGSRSRCEEHVCFPLPQGLLERLVLRPAGSRSTQQYNRQLDETVKVSAVLVDMTPELVDSPVPASPTNNDSDTNCMSPLDWQAALEVSRPDQ